MFLLLLSVGVSLSGEAERDSRLLVFSQVMILPSNQTTPGPTASLETLLASEVVVARCEAGCLTSWPDCSSPECSHCRTVCRHLVSTPAWLNICSAPRLCSPGCRAACHSMTNPGEELSETSRVWDIKQFGCTLIWEIEADQATHSRAVMYLVAALDTNNMFHHLDTVSSTNIILDPDTVSNVRTVIILAIGQGGVEERQEVEVESCQQVLLPESSGRVSTWTLTLILSTVSFLLLISAVGLARILCYLPRRNAVRF